MTAWSCVRGRSSPGNPPGGIDPRRCCPARGVGEPADGTLAAALFQAYVQVGGWDRAPSAEMSSAVGGPAAMPTSTLRQVRETQLTLLAGRPTVPDRLMVVAIGAAGQHGIREACQRAGRRSLRHRRRDLAPLGWVSERTARPTPVASCLRCGSLGRHPQAQRQARLRPELVGRRRLKSVMRGGT